MVQKRRGNIWMYSVIVDVPEATVHEGPLLQYWIILS